MTFDFGDDGSPTHSVSRLPLRKIVEKTSTSEAAKKRLQAERVAIRAAFASPRGQQALRILRQLFNHPAAYYTDEKLMCFFQGQRSVIEYIEEALDE